jgi:hypothetical protein
MGGATQCGRQWLEKTDPALVRRTKLLSLVLLGYVLAFATAQIIAREKTSAVPSSNPESTSTLSIAPSVDRSPIDNASVKAKKR